MKAPSAAAAAVLIVSALAASCAGAKRPSMQPAVPVPGTGLWQPPSELASTDLFYGPWGRENAPDPNAVYDFVERKHSGVNLGMTVRDREGREWSVKQPYPGGLDNEGPTEVAVSRLLSAIGYHQPPIYYLSAFKLRDDWGTHLEPGGRFRLKLQTLDELDAWDWEDNPFIASQPYKGLLVLLTMFNSTDLKNANNSLYERTIDGVTERWYVVRDLGAALGDTNRIAPFKGHIEAFEQTPFILGVNNGYVELQASSWYRKLVRNRITIDDVGWASSRLGQLSDLQWQDAFRAGGFDRAVSARFIQKLRSKIVEGHELAAREGIPGTGSNVSVGAVSAPSTRR